MSNTAATRKDIDDVLNVLDAMMSRIDERFSKVEGSVVETQGKVQAILNHLDHIEARILYQLKMVTIDQEYLRPFPQEELLGPQVWGRAFLGRHWKQCPLAHHMLPSKHLQTKPSRLC